MSDTTSTPTGPSGPVTDPVSTTPNLSISDIQNAVRVIDYACDQGAFKGWSVYDQVRAVRNRLNDFVTAVAPETPPTPAS